MQSLLIVCFWRSLDPKVSEDKGNEASRGKECSFFLDDSAAVYPAVDPESSSHIHLLGSLITFFCLFQKVYSFTPIFIDMLGK